MAILHVGEKGHSTEVDDDDIELISQYKWYMGRGYVKTFTSTGKSLMLHHLLLPPPEGMVVDHIDRNRLNNKRSNLRIASRSENGANRSSRSGASRFKGVIKGKTPGTWRAMIKIDGHHSTRGTYATEEDAARAYNKAAFDTWGEFAHLNEVEGWQDFEIKVTRWLSGDERGVYWHERAKKWGPRVTKNGKFQYLGLYETYEEAVEARKDYLKKHP